MQLKRFLKQASAEGVFGEIAPEQQRAWAANFPPNAARRMTRLGLLLGQALREFAIGPEDSVVYATTFAEATATERYLASFPAASPLLFQTSIHPGAIEQVLINRALPVRELTPLAGRENVGAQAVMTALLTPAERVVLAGGEETGTWLREIGACSLEVFAFALSLERESDGAIGEVSWTGETAAGGGGGSGGEAEDLPALFEAIRARQPLRWAAPSGGELALTWFSACEAGGGRS